MFLVKQNLQQQRTDKAWQKLFENTTYTFFSTMEAYLLGGSLF